MAVYIIIKAHYLPLEKKSYLRKQMYFFIWVANNGFFIATLSDIKYYRFTWEEFQIGYILFFGCGILFVIGGIIAIYTLITMVREDPKVSLGFYGCGSFKFLMKLPCTSIFKFVKLADDCCKNNSYKIWVDKLGNIVDTNIHCACGWKCTVYWIKMAVLLYTTFIYYISAIFLCIILIIIVIITKAFCIPPKIQELITENNEMNESLVDKSEENKNDNSPDENQNINIIEAPQKD